MLSSTFPTRRQLLARCGAGFGTLALADLLARQGLLASDDTTKSLNPLAPKKPHFPGKAKAVVWIFVNGGPSQVDTWDYKPELAKQDGKALPGMDKNTGFFINDVGPLMKSPFEFKQYGQSGKWVSSIFPNLSKHVDKMAFIHSLWTESNNHSPALFMMNTGLPRMGNPSVGSWVTYGLGSENENLPGFVVMSDPKGRGLPKGHTLNWTSGFLPGAFQGTWLKPSGDPIDNLKRPAGVTSQDQEADLALMTTLNRARIDQSAPDRELEARIKSFELAYRMQAAAPEAMDVARETKETQDLYGIGRPECDHFAKQCLTARRLVERGVRFVQIYSGGMDNQLSWDGHIDIKGNHSQFAGEVDRPVAALLTDLQNKGLLDSTLVIWAGEFGRLPVSQKGNKPGRDHNPHANTAWIAGGGAKGGVSYGATDDVGYKAAVDRADTHDFHATLLHLLGFDHEKLTYMHNGRRYRLTDVHGKVIKAVVA
ncbi:DUF1501 domain-containing protein [Fimbriiglobus ruber]|uniref:Sulfatase n=1 Tax=Fimbriiglobus ruber TaxID=1908690 RepID=A0A225DE47_9BACT|nr:DUF1501 domain-containing protein [Fimbriiglobus ruber]OWK39742.1 hypothetical protein FRUB_05632 [Fimbriiglobus ruber]